MGWPEALYGEVTASQLLMAPGKSSPTAARSWRSWAPGSNPFDPRAGGAEPGVVVMGSYACTVPGSGIATAALFTVIVVMYGKAASAEVGASGSEERRVGKECRSRWASYH